MASMYALNRSSLKIMKEFLSLLIPAFLVSGIGNAIGQEQRIEGFLGQTLVIECDIKDPSNVTFIVVLELNKERVQSFDMKHNKSYCNKDHVYYNKCISQMKDSHVSDNKMYFVINNASTHLNGIQSQCIVRYGSSLREDLRHPVKVIILKERHEPPASPTTSTSKPDIANATVSSNTTVAPNATKSPNKPTEGQSHLSTKEKNAIIAIGAVIAAVGVIVFVVICIRKKWYERLPCCIQHQEGNQHEPIEMNENNVN